MVKIGGSMTTGEKTNNKHIKNSKTGCVAN